MADVIRVTNIDTDIEINQGDILEDVEYVEYVKEENNTIEVSSIVFPKVVVLTQSCDLCQDATARKKNEEKKVANKEENHDKYLISVIVAPLYNFEDFRTGQHLEQLGLKMQNMGSINKSKCDNIIKNENKRYHFLRFDDATHIVDSVIDFKHYFTCNLQYLKKKKEFNYICSIDVLYRELISQRFSNFLSRIGLPDPE